MASVVEKIPLSELQYLFIMNSQQFNRQRRQNGAFVDYEKDYIRINGNPKSVEECKSNLEKKLEEVANYKQFKQLTLDPSVCSLVIGRGGANINRLRKDTKCKIFVNSSRDNENDAENNVLILAQNAEDLKAGVKAIQDINSRHQNEVTMKINVPNHLHGRLIGAKGKNLENIKKESGKSVRINFPPKSRSKNDTIEVSGDKKEVKKCIELIEKNVEELKREFGDEEEESTSEVSSQVEENKASSGQRHIPGYSGKKEINILKSSDVQVEELANAMNYLGIQNYQQKEVKENVWQTIGKKNKKSLVNEEEGDAEAEAETSAAKKKKNKKKNKKKKAAAQAEEDESAAEAERQAKEEEERRAKEEEEAALAAAAAEAEAALAASNAAAKEEASGSEEQKKKKKKNKKKKNSVAQAEDSAQEEPVSPPPEVVEEGPAEDDEWISIPTKKQSNKKKNNNNQDFTEITTASVNTFANLNDDSSEKKKKKNKKKKNNASSN